MFVTLFFLQVKNYHHARNVEKILEIIGNRISELDDASRGEVINYLGSVIQSTSPDSFSAEEMSSSPENVDESDEE
uniref:Uncharacterized protein n=1 Tax=Ditylenchus dipsaci TaxID=166011 RepID=A0A915EFF0_9BILA